MATEALDKVIEISDKVVDYVKVNKTRRSRGYTFEHDLVVKINSLQHWQARRLGGSSTGLPDIVAVNNFEGVLVAIEAKSKFDVKEIHIPKKEVQRCIDIANMFERYASNVMFSFKFSNSKRLPVIWHFILDKELHENMVMNGFEDVACTIDGKCLFKYYGTYVELKKFRWSFEKEK